MKIKFFAIVFCLILASLFVTCCAKDETETTAPDFTWEDIPTEPVYSMDEMSPDFLSTDIEIEFEKNYKNYPLYEFSEIKGADSIIKNTQAAKILKKDNIELYYMDADGKVFIIISDEDGNAEFSGSYNLTEGNIEFMGNEDKSWYYNPDGSLLTMAYTFSMGRNYKGIVSFYTPDGTRDFVIAAGGYYTGDLTPLTDDEAFPYLQKYAKTSELFNK